MGLTEFNEDAGTVEYRFLVLEESKLLGVEIVDCEGERKKAALVGGVLH